MVDRSGLPEHEREESSLGRTIAVVPNTISQSPAPHVDEALVQLLIDRIEDFAIIVLDVEGKVVGWNAGAECIHGYKKSEVLGCHFSLFYPPNEVLDGRPQHDLAMAAKANRFAEEGLRIRKDGLEFWASNVIAVLHDDAGVLRGYALITRDITARKRNEDGLRLMVELSLNAIVLVNIRGEVVSLNAQTEKMFGYTRQQLIGQPVEILVPDRFKRDHPKNRAGFFADPVVRPMGAGRDLFGRRSNGAEFPVEIGLSPIETVDGQAVLGSIVDITERKKAEERFRLAVESAPNAMVMINRDGRIVLVNLQTERLFGYSRDELLRQPVEILVPDRFRVQHPAFRSAFLSQPKARSMGAGRELYGRRKNGSEFPVEIGLNPIETGEDTFVLSAIVDITERKEAEERVRKHLSDLAHVARLSTVGQMFSELAHEINQPLAAAANYARACVSFARSGKGATQNELIEWMEKTVAQTTRAIDIVKRLGSFVKKDGGTRTLININRLIEQVVSLSVPVMLTTTDATEPVRLELILDPGVPEISADSVQIEQVLLNLVRNAIEAMQDSPAARRKLTLRTSHDDVYVRIAVSDNGPGIKGDQFARLFDPYFTTKATGIGLGLSISRSIVEDHEGRMEVETSDAGTTFQFVLPIDKSGQIA